MSESGVLPARILPDFRQFVYAHRILSLFNLIPIKDIFFITLQTGDRNAQPEDVPECNTIWSSAQHIRTYGQHLARQTLIGFSIDPAEEVEPFSAMPAQVFPGKVFIEKRSRAIQVAKEDKANLACVTDPSWTKEEPEKQ